MPVPRSIREKNETTCAVRLFPNANRRACAMKLLPERQRIKFILNGMGDALKKSNPQVDAWLDEARTKSSLAERKAIYEKVAEKTGAGGHASGDGSLEFTAFEQPAGSYEATASGGAGYTRSHRDAGRRAGSIARAVRASPQSAG